MDACVFGDTCHSSPLLSAGLSGVSGMYGGDRAPDVDGLGGAADVEGTGGRGAAAGAADAAGLGGAADVEGAGVEGQG